MNLLEDDIQELEYLLEVMRISDFSTEKQDAALSHMRHIAKWSMRKARIRKAVAGVAAMVLLCVLPGHSQADGPRPKLFDRENTFAFTASALMRTGDTIQTCRYMKQRAIITVGAINQPNRQYSGGTIVTPVFKESWAPVNSCGGIIAWNTGGQAAVFGAMSILNRTGHPRMARIVPWLSFAGSAFAVVNNFHQKRATLPHVPPGATITVRIR